MGLCFAVSGCAGDDSACPTQPEDCPTLRDDCTIAELSCQRQIFAATACIRAQCGATMPPIRTITRDEYAEELRATDAPDEDFGSKVWGKALGLFGLVPREESIQEADVAQRVASIAAFYRRDTKAVTIISDTSMDPKRAVLTLSHEFVHALQDQRERLQPFYNQHARNSDSNNALKSLTEGEAVVLSNLTVLHFRGEPFDQVDWADYFGSWLARERTRVEEAPAPLLAARSLVYPVGGAGVWRAYSEGGLAGISSLYADPPHTFQHWATQGEGAREPAPLRCPPPMPPAGFGLKFLDSQGMVGLVALYAGLGKGVLYDEATAWTSDGFAVYADPDEVSDEVAVSWRVRFADAAAAEQLATFASEAGLGIEARLFGEEVMLSAASSAELLAKWEERSTCGDASADKGRIRARISAPAPRARLHVFEEALQHAAPAWPGRRH